MFSVIIFAFLPIANPCIFHVNDLSYSLEKLGMIDAADVENAHLNWIYYVHACTNLIPDNVHPLCIGKDPAPAFQVAGDKCYRLGDRVAQTNPLSHGLLGTLLLFRGGEGGRSVTLTLECSATTDAFEARALPDGASYSVLVRSPVGCPLECPRDKSSGAICGGPTGGVCSKIPSGVGCLCWPGYAGAACNKLDHLQPPTASYDKFAVYRFPLLLSLGFFFFLRNGTMATQLVIPHTHDHNLHVCCCFLAVLQL